MTQQVSQFSGAYGSGLWMKTTLNYNAKRQLQVRVYLSTAPGYSLNVGSKPLEIHINGTGAIEHINVNMASGRNDVLVFARDYDVGASDRAKTIVANVSVSIKINAYNYGQCDHRLSLTIPAEVQKSSLSVPGSVTLDTSLNITINNSMPNSVTHRIGIQAGSKWIEWSNNQKTGSSSWNVPISLADQYVTSLTGRATIKMWTKASGREIGYTEKSIEVRLPSDRLLPSPPSNITVHESNDKVNTLLKGVSFLANHSKLNIAYTPGDLKYGARISTYEIDFDGVRKFNSSSSSLTIDDVVERMKTFKIRQRDSRGLWSNWSSVQTIKVQPYTKPIITYTIERGGEKDDQLVVNRTVKVSPILDSSNNNINKFTIVYSEVEGSSESLLTSETFNEISEITNQKIVLPGTYSTDRSYVVNVYITDILSMSNKTKTIIGTLEVPVAYGVDRLGIGKIPEQAGIDSAWPFFYKGKQPLYEGTPIDVYGLRTYRYDSNINLNDVLKEKGRNSKGEGHSFILNTKSFNGSPFDGWCYVACYIMADGYGSAFCWVNNTSNTAIFRAHININGPGLDSGWKIVAGATKWITLSTQMGGIVEYRETPAELIVHYAFIASGSKLVTGGRLPDIFKPKTSTSFVVTGWSEGTNALAQVLVRSDTGEVQFSSLTKGVRYSGSFNVPLDTNIVI